MTPRKRNATGMGNNAPLGTDELELQESGTCQAEGTATPSMCGTGQKEHQDLKELE